MKDLSLTQSIKRYVAQCNAMAYQFSTLKLNTGDYMMPQIPQGLKPPVAAQIDCLNTSQAIATGEYLMGDFLMLCNRYASEYYEDYFEEKPFLVYLIYTCMVGRMLGHHFDETTGTEEYARHWEQYYFVIFNEIKIDGLGPDHVLDKYNHGVGNFEAIVTHIENNLDELFEMGREEVLERHQNKTLPNMFYTAMYCLYEYFGDFLPLLMTMEKVEPTMGLQNMVDVITGVSDLSDFQ